MASFRSLAKFSVFAVAGGLLVTSAVRALAQEVRSDFSSTSPQVNTVLLSGNTLYIGGDFYLIGPSTGGAASVDLATGMAQRPYPRVAGRVNSAAPDGAGGWFIGGQFTQVDSYPRQRLAHILADGTVSPWDPGADNGVSQILVSGTTVYVAGVFEHTGGEARHSLAALDATTGAALPFNPNPASYGDYAAVSTMALLGNQLYVGGGFDTIGGASQPNIARLDATTGACQPWSPYPGLPLVTALTLAPDSVLWVGTASDVRAVDPATGAPRFRIVSVGGPVHALAVHGNTVYVAGEFGSLDHQPREFIGAIDIARGAASSWNPSSSYIVQTLATVGSTVYAGGGFTIMGGQTRWCAAALDSATGQATSWDPRMNAEVNVLVPDGDRMFAGGVFTGVGGEIRRHLAAIDVTTGKPTAWKPDPDNIVYSLAGMGSTLYVGGSFTRIGGAPRNGAASIDLNTGAVTSWDPSPDRTVETIAASPSQIYLGGNFTTVGGQPRNLIAAVDPTSGAPTAWNPDVELPAGTLPFRPHPPYPEVRKLTTDGSRVFFGGTFTRVNGMARRHLAAVDATTGALTPWDPSASYIVYSMALAGNTVYAGGAFDTVGGAARRYVAAVDTSEGLATPWNPGADGGVFSLLPHDSTVYVGGGFHTLGNQPRLFVGALGAASGAPTSWDPKPDGTILDMTIDGLTMYAGGDFRTIGGLPQSGMAAITVLDGAVPALISFLNSQVSANQVVLRWYTPDGSGAAARVLRRGETGDWSILGDVVSDATGQLVYTDATVVAGHRYEYEVETLVGGQETMSGETWVTVPLEPFALYGTTHNPAVGRDLSVAFSLSGSSPAWLTLFDIGGRLIDKRDVGSLGAGYHEVRIDPSRRISAGVYLIELSQGGRSLTSRAVVLP